MAIYDVKKKEGNRFMKLVAQLESVEFYGIAQILGVEIYEGTPTNKIVLREPNAVFYEIADNLCHAAPKVRKQLMKQMRKTIKGYKHFSLTRELEKTRKDDA